MKLCINGQLYIRVVLMIDARKLFALGNEVQ